MSDEEPAVTELMRSEPAYSSSLGAAYQGDSRHLLEELPDESIDLVVTSPPFALQHQKEYGNENIEAYNDWFIEFAREVERVLAPHGSFVIEIGGAFEQGKPRRSTYREELLLRLTGKGDEADPNLNFAQDFYWFNRAKLPNPVEWVNVRRIRATDAVTNLWWLSKDINEEPAYTAELQEKIPLIEKTLEPLTIDERATLAEAILRGTPTGEDGYYTERVQALVETKLPEYADEIEATITESGQVNQRPTDFVLQKIRDGKTDLRPRPRPEANNQRVLQEYSDSQEKLLESGEYNEGSRPSGWNIDADAFANGNEGAIPKNLIEAANTASNTHYLEMCRKFSTEDNDIEPHPARFPRQIPEFFIEFLTPQPSYEDWDRGALTRPIVLDIFAGSNMTGAAAEDAGRFWLSFEREEKYIETSRFRFKTEEQLTAERDESQSDFGDFPEVTKD